MPTIDEVFKAVRLRLEELAAAAATALDDFATTLAVVVVGEGHVEVGQVGDSIVVVRDTDGSFHAASPAKKFEYANETVFLTSNSWRDHLRVDRFKVEDVTGVALSTDGLRFKILGDLMSGKPYEPFFEDVFGWFDSDTANSDAVARFIARLDDQSGDDKTLVVAQKGQQEEPVTPTLVVNEHITEPVPGSGLNDSASVHGVEEGNGASHQGSDGEELPT